MKVSECSIIGFMDLDSVDQTAKCIVAAKIIGLMATGYTKKQACEECDVEIRDFNAWERAGILDPVIKEFALDLHADISEAIGMGMRQIVDEMPAIMKIAINDAKGIGANGEKVYARDRQAAREWLVDMISNPLLAPQVHSLSTPEDEHLAKFDPIRHQVLVENNDDGGSTILSSLEIAKTSTEQEPVETSPQQT